MARTFLVGRACWMRHLSLNFTTGLDPANIRVRNAQGLDAIDFFFPGMLFLCMMPWSNACLFLIQLSACFQQEAC
jgi:hypothetical protein